VFPLFVVEVVDFDQINTFLDHVIGRAEAQSGKQDS
jgi:hypothetical protein